MTHIHLAVNNGDVVQRELGDLSEGSFYMIGDQLYRLLVNPCERHGQSDFATALVMEDLTATFPPTNQIVRPVTLKSVRIEVDTQ